MWCSGELSLLVSIPSLLTADNVDGPSDTSNIGGPGGIIDGIEKSPESGGLGSGASGLCSTGLSFITALSLAILTLITKLLH